MTGLDSTVGVRDTERRFELRGSDLLLVGLVVLGVVCRLNAFGAPRDFLFDEHHFVNNARNYLAGQADQNDHPPLGKLLMAGAIALLGDSSSAWRFPACILGLASLALAGGAAARLFASARAGWFAVALCAADGFLISYSRAALLDGYLAFTGLGLLLTVTFAATPLSGLVAGLWLGLALAIKFSGVALLVPIGVWLALAPIPQSRRLQVLAVALAVASVTYCSVYAFGLHLAGQRASLELILAETRRLYVHHSELTDMKNPATSGWSTWWLPVRPLVLGYSDEFGSVRALTSLGNLAAWWSSVALALGSLGTIAWYGLRGVVAPSAEAEVGGAGASRGLDHPERPEHPLLAELYGFVQGEATGVLRALALAIGFLAPWVLTHRDSYIYHFLPAYAALLVLLAGFLAHAEPRHKLRVLGFLGVVLVVAAFYAPVWSFSEIDAGAFRARLFLRSWR